MEVTTEMLFSLIGELFVQTRMQARMLQQRESENVSAAGRAIPDYQAWRKDNPDSVVQQDREGPRSKGTPEGEKI